LHSQAKSKNICAVTEIEDIWRNKNWCM